MPPEDQNTGTSPETPTTEQEVSSTAQDTSSVSQETSTESQSTSQDNSVGAALSAFDALRAQEQGVQPVSSAPVQRPPSRDFSDLPPEVVPWFKKMGDHAFNGLKPIYLEYLQLKKDHTDLKKQHEESSKSSFFEHENAWQLTPEFNEHVAQHNQATREINHWTEQLALIEDGQEWTPIVLDDKGNPVLGEPEPASPRAKAEVLNALLVANNYKTQSEDKITALKANFSSQHKNFAKSITDIREKVFQGADQKQLDAAMRSKLPLFPSYMHGQPLVQTLATALAVIDGLFAMLEGQKSAAVTNQIKKSTTTTAGPTNGMIRTPAKAGETVDSVMKQFEKARALGIA